MPLSPGDLLAAKYRIEAEIGRGAFGRVYRARDIDLDRVVAIKELHRGQDDLGSTQFSDYVRRFEREARVQARFNHPNIVHVYELLRLADDRLYLVMEYVDGGSLRDYLARRGPLPVDEALRIMAHLLAGLAAVHHNSGDIVHRDIKPSNVLLTKGGQAKLTDFGLAQVGDESMRSGAGQPHPGSPMYMSPEQETTNAYLYPASDVFSAGCVLFELLTGTVYKQAKRRKQGLAALRPDAPEWLAEIVARALARETEARYTDAGEMAAELAAELAAAKTAAANARRAEEEARLAAERKALADAAALTELLAEVETMRRQMNWRALLEAGLKIQLLPSVQEAARVTGLDAFLDGWHLLDDDAYWQSFDYALALSQLDRAGEAMPAQAGLWISRGALRMTRSHQLKTGEWSQALADLDHAISLAPAEARGYYARGSCLHNQRFYTEQGDYERAIADETRAIELDPTRAIYYRGRGASYSNKGDYDRAIADFSKAIELDPQNALYWSNRGSCYHNKKDHDRAIADQTRAIELAPQNAEYWNYRGVSYGSKGDTDRAIADYSKAIELAPQNALYWCNRGIDYHNKKDYDRAIADQTRAIELDPRNGKYYYSRSQTYRAKGDSVRAAADEVKARELGYKA